MVSVIFAVRSLGLVDNCIVQDEPDTVRPRFLDLRPPPSFSGRIPRFVLASESESAMNRGDSRQDSISRGTLVHSFSHAVAGWRQAVLGERNMRIHLIAACIVIGLCWYLPLSATECGLMVLAVAIVWVSELVNTSIERLVDLVSPEHHELAGQAKDVAAAAVLTAAVAAILLGLLVLGPHAVGALTAGNGSS